MSQTRLLCKADDYRKLDTIKGMVDAGNISQVKVQTAFPLAQIGEAYNEQGGGHVVGKVSITVSAAPNATSVSTSH